MRYNETTNQKIASHSYDCWISEINIKSQSIDITETHAFCKVNHNAQVRSLSVKLGSILYRTSSLSI